MDANNEFDKLVKDKLAKGTQKVPAELKGIIESRLVREGFIKKSSGGGKWLLGSFSVIAILAILAGGYYYLTNNSETVNIRSSVSEKNDPKNLIAVSNSENNNSENQIQEKRVDPKCSSVHENRKGDGSDEINNSSDSIVNSVQSGSLSETLAKNKKYTPEKESGEKHITHNISKTNNTGTENKGQINEIREVQNNLQSANTKSNTNKTKDVTATKKDQSKDLLVVNNSGTNSGSSKADKKEQNEISSPDAGSGELKEISVDKNKTVNDISVEKQNSTQSNNVVAENTDKNNLSESNTVAKENKNSTSDLNSGISRSVNSEQPVTSSELKDDAKIDSVASDSSNKSVEVITGGVPVIYPDAVDSAAKDSAFIARYSIEVFGGLQFTMKQGVAYTNSKGENLNSAKSSEVIAGLKLNYFIGKFSVGTGINYSKHSSQIPTIYNTFYHDTSSLNIPISIAGTVKTDYSILDIPVLIGYNFKMNRFAVHVESGISFSFISDAKSVFELEDANFTTDTLSLLTPEKSYTNYVGQVSFLYSVSRKLQVMIQPSFNYGLSGIFKEIPEEKINVFSLKAGLRLNF